MRTLVTFDCADPHAQAAFWAQVFGAVVEDHSAFVDQLVADGRMSADDRVEIGDHSAFCEVAACSDPTGVEPRLPFQRVPEEKSPSTACTSTFTSTPTIRTLRSNG